MAEKVNFVSLGDSIATGTLTPFAKTASYAAYLPGKIRQKGYQTKVYHLAQDGDTSKDLLWKLEHSRHFRQLIGQADLITVSIGGNDLMRASSIPGFASINQRVASHGAKTFVRNWPRIVEEIRSLNRHGEVVVLNLYNPYNHTRQEGRLCELTDRFLAEINHAIAAHAQGNYKIADTYAAFKRYEQGEMYRVSCLYPANSMLRNPHPTPAAQRLITDLIWAQLEL